MAHELTRKALDTLAEWGRNPNPDGGENIAFSLCRRGTSSDAFVAFGDCTPFTASGARGVLHGRPDGSAGAPIACFDNSGAPTPAGDLVPCTFAFDLNAGKVALNGAFPNLPENLDFTVEYLREFQGCDGRNILFHSGKASDDAGYVMAVQLVAAS